MALKRYVQVGVGARSIDYRKALGTPPHNKHGHIAAFCDTNLGRLQLAARIEQEAFANDVAVYPAAEFDRMIAEQQPDCVIITSMDVTHDFYICRAMELGCDVITEKPMTIDEARCQRILETQRRTGRTCTVTFNYRYSPVRAQVKELLMSGVIGEVQSVVYQWMLDTNHGADYFRRWHRNKKNSGGLMVHKATHHFDLVNWWLSTVPERVSATGHRHFYTPETADARGLTARGERCHGCPEAANCGFFLDMTAAKPMTWLYLECEQHDGYFRDRCVFSPDIDIEDSMHLTVDYRNGVKMTYSLNAFCPQEGYVITFYGTRGALEHRCVESSYVNADGTVPGVTTAGTSIRVIPHDAPDYEPELWTGEGGHGGGDPLLLADLFAPDAPEDKYLRKADQRAGAWSILTGVAANRSMGTGRPVRIDELVPDIELPDYPPMPSE